MSQKGQLLHEGKAKQVYETSNPDEVIIHYKDTATAFDGKKKEEITDKGILNNAISNILFRKLIEKNIPTHLIDILNDREILAKKIKIIPLEVVCRNVVAGSLHRRTGIAEGTEIPGGIIEFYYKNDDLGDPLFTMEQIRLMKLANDKEIEKLKELGTKINQSLTEIFKSIGLILVDFKLEFGYYKDNILLGDEISPDTCRLWDAETKKILDKDRFRKDMGNVTDAYQEVLTRLKTIA